MGLVSSSFSSSFFVGNRPFRIRSVTQLPSLEVWYDGAYNSNFNKTTSITSGTEVTSWQNGGGLTSHDWNSTGGKRPEWFSSVQNGLGVVRFNAATDDADTDELLSINPVAYLQSLSGVTMALLFRTLSTSAGRRILTTTNTGGFQWGQNGTQWIGGMAGGAFTVNSITADTNFHHIIITFDGSQTGNANRVKARLDGSEVSLTFSTNVNPTTSAAAADFYGGVDTTGNSNYWNGDVGELLIWTRALNINEVLAVEDYLTNKWAV